MACRAARYVLPIFPVTANVWRGNDAFPQPVPDLATEAVLLRNEQIITVGGNQLETMLMKFPALTDVRDAYSIGATADYIEYPAASGRYYRVLYVDDLAKGFPNQHRFAVVYKTVNPQTGALWPVPIP